MLVPSPHLQLRLRVARSSALDPPWLHDYYIQADDRGEFPVSSPSTYIPRDVIQTCNKLHPLQATWWQIGDLVSGVSKNSAKVTCSFDYVHGWSHTALLEHRPTHKKPMGRGRPRPRGDLVSYPDPSAILYRARWVWVRDQLEYGYLQAHVRWTCSRGGDLLGRKCSFYIFGCKRVSMAAPSGLFVQRHSCDRRQHRLPVYRRRSRREEWEAAGRLSSI